MHGINSEMNGTVETPSAIQSTAISLASSKLIVVPDSGEVYSEHSPSLDLPHHTVELRFGEGLTGKLLDELFCAARRDEMGRQDPISVDIQKGKLGIIKNLELYMQHVLSYVKSECWREVDIIEFANDAIAIKERLQLPFCQLRITPNG